MGVWPNFRLLLFTLGASLSSGQTIQRALRPEELRGMHTILDSDGDGKVSMSEGLTYVRQHRRKLSHASTLQILANMDSNKDGRLDLQEFQKDLNQWKMEEDEKEDAISKFSAYDQDQDGILDEEESLLFFYWLFDFRKADGNSDGSLTFKEFRKAAAKKSKSQGDGVANPEDREVFKGLDADRNKRLCLQEYVSFKTGTFAAEEAMRKLFQLADKDDDIHLSTSELVEARQGMAGSNAYYHFWDWAKHEGVLLKDSDL